ncbi:MAG: type II secretion system protein [Candidatus Dojkabacteria bacterium]
MKAFTLLEAIIAMGIMAVLLGFSTYALTQVRSTIELQNAFSDVASALQVAQNRSRNSATKPGSPNVAQDYVTVAFRNTTYAFQTCIKGASRVTCVDDTANAKAIEVLHSTIQPSVNCNTIGFSRLTGDIVTVDSNGVVNSSGTCTIKISHTATGNFKQISIDLTSNNITSN